jgi:hypothetical protein
VANRAPDSRISSLHLSERVERAGAPVCRSTRRSSVSDWLELQRVAPCRRARRLLCASVWRDRRPVSRNRRPCRRIWRMPLA